MTSAFPVPCKNQCETVEFLVMWKFFFPACLTVNTLQMEMLQVHPIPIRLETGLSLVSPVWSLNVGYSVQLRLYCNNNPCKRLLKCKKGAQGFSQYFLPGYVLTYFEIGQSVFGLTILQVWLC